MFMNNMEYAVPAMGIDKVSMGVKTAGYAQDMKFGDKVKKLMLMKAVKKSKSAGI